jgi:hypothetical protein
VARVGITQLKINRLEEREYNKLFRKHEKDWLRFAERAFEFVRDNIARDHRPRADDILTILLPIIASDGRLLEHQAFKGPREKDEQAEFREYFAEFVIDMYLESRR